MTAVTPEMRVGIHQAISIDCLTFKQASDVFNVPPDKCKLIYEETCKEFEGRFITRNEYHRQWRAEQLDDLRGRAVRAFEASGGTRRKKTVEKTKLRRVTDDGQVYYESGNEKTTQVTETMIPDAKFITAAISAISGISDLYGLNSPKQLNINEHSIVDVYLNLPTDRGELEKMAMINTLKQQGVLKIADKAAIDVIPISVTKESHSGSIEVLPVDQKGP